MSHFSFKNRTIPQLFLLTLAGIGMINVIHSMLFDQSRDWSETIPALVLFLACIWAGTNPNSEEEKIDNDDSFDDVLDK